MIQNTHLATESVIARSSSPDETNRGWRTVKDYRVGYNLKGLDARLADAPILIPLRGRARMRGLPPKGVYSQRYGSESFNVGV
jgi:hypothetical protein